MIPPKWRKINLHRDRRQMMMPTSMPARALAAVFALWAVAACDTTTTSGTDFGVVLPGCRAPSACYEVAACACMSRVVDDCKRCEPTGAPGAVCQCGPMTVDGGPADAGGPQQCLEPAQLCVGRGAVCPGRGAVCLRAGKPCSESATADADPRPPDLVSAPGPVLLSRCPFVDDTCCPGTDTGD
jgi:hypothetical protein